MARPDGWALCVAIAMLAAPVAAGQGGRVRTTELKVERTEYDMAKLAALPALSPAEFEGRRIFLQKCLTCHERSAPWLDRTVIARGEDAFREKTLTGSRAMPGFQYALQPLELDQMIAYLKTVTPDQKPRPAAPRR